jgi:hypothetical protein
LARGSWPLNGESSRYQPNMAIAELSPGQLPHRTSVLFVDIVVDMELSAPGQASPSGIQPQRAHHHRPAGRSLLAGCTVSQILSMRMRGVKPNPRPGCDGLLPRGLS